MRPITTARAVTTTIVCLKGNEKHTNEANVGMHDFQHSTLSEFSRY
jgi:hypothetical protein